MNSQDDHFQQVNHGFGDTRIDGTTHNVETKNIAA